MGLAPRSSQTAEGHIKIFQENIARRFWSSFMLPLNTQNKLPESLWRYTLARISLIFVIFSLLLIFVLFSFLDKNIWLSLSYVIFFFFCSLLVLAYTIFSYKFISFVITESAITINSGIVFKRSNTIPFNKTQNIDISRDPLITFFGLSKLDIWTSSPSQIKIED